MPTWPATLPQKFLQSGFSDSEPQLFTITQMDAGPPKVRRRFTVNSRMIQGEMNLTLAQKAILRTFYGAYGGGRFYFPDPDGGDNLSVIFADVPTYVGIDGGDQRVSLKLTVMPV